jgi:cell fate regulator YaaT (PSP1 superfamily)
LKPALRLASEEELRMMLSFKSKEKEALVQCAHHVKQHQLPMKLVEAEYTFDGSRLTFYFTADERVDFRALVRDLATTFRTRIELRQIGARDQAKLQGGVGICGKTLCCSSWISDFGVVSIKMAKEQDLPLNPSKISGVCGRLLCCLSYENDTYIQARQTMPSVGTFLDTPGGQGRVVSINVPKSSVEVLLDSGVIIQWPVEQQETKSVGGCGSCSKSSAKGGGCSAGGGCGVKSAKGGGCASGGACSCSSGANDGLESGGGGGCGSCGVKRGGRDKSRPDDIRQDDSYIRS